MKLPVPLTSLRGTSRAPTDRPETMLFCMRFIIKRAGCECCPEPPLSRRGYVAVSAVNSFAALIWRHFDRHSVSRGVSGQTVSVFCCCFFYKMMIFNPLNVFGVIYKWGLRV